MDTLRSNGGHYDRYGASADDDLLDAPGSADRSEDSLPPPAIGTNERRMQVRAYNFWASQLDDRNYPPITSLDPARVGDFAGHGVLLDFSGGSDNPRIAYLGAELADECDIGGETVARLSDVPARSLLSRITDHYMQILANQAPIGFEAEFVNQRGATILYRGILLPFSSDDTTIDFIYGVINWKVLVDQSAADELLLEIDQVLDPPASRRRRIELTPLADWADGPGAVAAEDVADAEFAEIMPLIGHGGDSPADHAAAGDPDGSDLTGDFADMALGDWLARAREQADHARDREDRTRNALYEAIGRAWDFALAAAAAPQDFAAMLTEAGLSMQQRAPMTPVVKLVFGADYDKTRLTEYAAALAHAQRSGLARGTLAEHLRRAEGGLKGIVAAERRLRREEAGKPPRETSHQPRPALAQRLRDLPLRDLATLATPGAEEFALVMVRRTDRGDVHLLGEVPGDVALLEKAARTLLG